MEANNLVQIELSKIYPHPDNPRKNLGDITELSESIKKNGVMQNLTVIKGHALTDEEYKELAEKYKEDPSEELREFLNKRWSTKGYTAIIGHRRCAAAKLTELTTVPCRVIEEMPYKEQISVMLEENMQRNDLTIYEQAQGFQMMLDLGETEDGIAQKTGFSKTTIHRRINIGKLDQNILKEKEQQEDYQLSLTDLYELERVKDLEKRNEILKKADGQRSIKWQVEIAVKREQQEENKALYIKQLKALGITKAPKKVENEWYGSKWERVKEYNLNKKPPKKLTIETSEETLYYLERYESLYIVQKAKKTKKELTPKEKKQEEKEKNKKKLKAILKHMTEQRKVFIEKMISGNIKPLEKEKENTVIEVLFEEILDQNIYIGYNGIKEFFLGKECYNATKEENEVAEKKAKNLNLCHKMFCLLSNAAGKMDLMNWDGTYHSRNGHRLAELYAILKLYGFTVDDEEELKVINGSSELYEKGK